MADDNKQQEQNIIPGVPNGALNGTGNEGVPNSPKPDGMDEEFNNGATKDENKPAPKQEEAKPDENKKPDAQPKPDENKDGVDWATLGNPAADAAIDIMKSKGITAEAGSKFFDKALQTGKVDDIDRAGLEAAIGKSAADLVMIGAKQYYDDTVAQAAANQTMAAEIVGGIENLTALRDWTAAKEAADPAFAAELADIRAMMSASKTGLKQGLVMLKEMHAKDPKTKTGGTLLTGGGAAVGQVTEPTLSREDYVREMAKWSTKAEWGDPEAQRMVRNLRDRRLAAMQRR